MFEVQALQKQLEANLQPASVSDFVLTMMQNRYGSEFNRKFEGQTKGQLRAQTSTVLAGLNMGQITLGLERLRHESRCPSISGFRELCEDWIGPNEAWADAIVFRKNKKHPITELTKQALDRVTDMLIDTDDNREAAQQLNSAGFAFREIYNSLVIKAKLNNDVQRKWTGEDESETKQTKYHIQPEPSVYERLNDSQRSIVDRQQQLVAEGMDHRTALNQARKELSNQKLNKLDNPELQEKVKKQPKHQNFETEFQKLVADGMGVKDAFQQCKLEGSNK